MNTLSVTLDKLAFAGKANVYFSTLSQLESKIQPAERFPNLSFSSEWNSKNGHIECIALNTDGKLIAVGDSMHSLHLYELKNDPTNPSWHEVFCCNSDKRLVKLRFSSDGQFITFLDKQGDIFAVRLNSDRPLIPKIKKLMGHTSFISDYIVCNESNQILSCDRDEKIRVSNFPDAFVIQGFKLGHTESVINITVIESPPGENFQRLILSISLSGALMLWEFENPVCRTSSTFLKTWNIKEFLNLKDQVNENDAEARTMKACFDKNKIYVSIVFGGSQKIHVLGISRSNLSLESLQTLETGSDLFAMEWTTIQDKVTLIVFTPTTKPIRWWCPSISMNKLEDKSLEFSDAMMTDIKALDEVHKQFSVPMKKRLTNFEDSVSFSVTKDLSVKKVKA